MMNITFFFEFSTMFSFMKIYKEGKKVSGKIHFLLFDNTTKERGKKVLYEIHIP